MLQVELALIFPVEHIASLLVALSGTCLWTVEGVHLYSRFLHK